MRRIVPVVTIDGPAASGKSSVSRELAHRLGWSWVSTGAFYRGLAYVAYQKKLDLSDEPKLVSLACSPIWSVEMEKNDTHVLLDGVDVTEEIHKEQTGSLASAVSQYPRVRRALLDAQRNCAMDVVGLVAEGRDCGTVVFPAAAVKFFLTAKARHRAARRALEEGKSVGETRDAQSVRDSQDANRTAAPMQTAPDAFVIDTSDMDLEQVVSTVEKVVRARLKL